MDGLFADLIPQVYGPGAAESGQQATTQQQAYAAAAARQRDPAAPAGTAANPSYDTPSVSGAPESYHVDPAGGLHDPNPQVSLGIFDDLLPGGAIHARTSEALGLEKGLAEPFHNLWDRVSNSPTLGVVANSLDAAFPELDVIHHTTERLAGPAMEDVARKEASGVLPGKLGQFTGNAIDTIALPGGPLTQGAETGFMLSHADSPMGVGIDMAEGALGGKLAHGALGAVSHLISPNVAPQAKTLIDEGIPLTAGQIRGGSLRRVEDAATSIPILGDVIGAAKLRSLKGLNVAVANRALAPIGESVPPHIAAGREAITYAGDRLSDGYNKLLPGLKIQADPEFGEAIRTLGDMASDLPAEHSKMFGRFMAKTVMDKFNPQSGIMSGEAMKDAETAIGQRINRYRQSPAPADQDFADALTQLQSELRSMVARNNPEAAEKLSALNKGWANLAIGENATSRLGAHEGLFTPAQLAGAVKKSDSTVRNRGYARGTALMQDLSDAALSRLPSSVPDSGSPLRHAVEGAVALGVGKESGMPIVGHAAMGGAVLSWPYTEAGQKLTQTLLAGKRPAVSPGIAAILDRLKPIARVSGSVGLPMLTSSTQ